MMSRVSHHSKLAGFTKWTNSKTQSHEWSDSRVSTVYMVPIWPQLSEKLIIYIVSGGWSGKQKIQFGRCLFFTNKLIFWPFEARNKQFSKYVGPALYKCYTNFCVCRIRRLTIHERGDTSFMIHCETSSSGRLQPFQQRTIFSGKHELSAKGRQ